jgi:hypothetical protein
MLVRGATPVYAQRVWVTHADATKALCTLPANALVFGLDVWVHEAFNAAGLDDALEVGYASDHNAYMAALAVVATGVKTPVLGDTAKTIDATTRDVIVYLTYTSTAPSTGEALVTIYYFVAPATP